MSYIASLAVMTDDRSHVDEIISRWSVEAKLLQRKGAAVSVSVQVEDDEEETEAIDVLRELVALKDGPRDEDYERRKPLAWQQAREVLGRGDRG